MQITVGPFRYEIVARSTKLTNDQGEPCLGLAWPDLSRVEFSMLAQPDKRWGLVWHELIHLFKADFDIRGHESKTLGEEAVCNLIGLVMAMMEPIDIMRLHVYVMQGIDAPAAMLHPGLPHPIPVFHFSPPRA
jgi:hypothetical protein